MKQIRKLLALVLALAMCMSMFSVNVWATNTPESMASDVEHMEALMEEAKNASDSAEAAPEEVKEIEQELGKVVSEVTSITQKNGNSAELAPQAAVSLDPVHIKASYNKLYNWLKTQDEEKFYYRPSFWNSVDGFGILVRYVIEGNSILCQIGMVGLDSDQLFTVSFSINQNGVEGNKISAEYGAIGTYSIYVYAHAAITPETCDPNRYTYSFTIDDTNIPTSLSAGTKLLNSVREMFSALFPLFFTELDKTGIGPITLGDVGFIAADSTKTDSIHTYGTSTVTKQATCAEAGVRSSRCTICGQTKTESIPATGNHKWDDGTITKEPTYTEDGVMTYTCTGCGKTKTESIPAKEKESNEVYTDDIVLSYSDKKQTVNLNASNFYETEMTYESDTDEVSVNDEGIATIDAGFSGVAVITVTSVETEEYAEAEETLKITVPTVTNVKKATVKKKQLTVEWKKNTTGKGYEVQCSTDKNFKKSVKKVKIGKNKTTKTTIKNLKKGTYYVRIRTVNGKKTSAWSKTKSVKVK